MELLKACDAAHTACQESNKIKDSIIKSQDEQLSNLTKRNTELSGASDHRLLWFVAGMLVTGVTAYLVRK